MATTKSVNITILDAVPATGYVGTPTLSAGEGAPARLKMIEDACPVGLAATTTASVFKILRFPTTAKIKKLEVWSDLALDITGTTSVLVMSFGVMFSDSTTDGTPAGVRGLVPNVSGLGTTVATPSTAGTNDLFGSVAARATALDPMLVTDITFTSSGGTTTTTGPTTGYAGLTNYGTPTVSGAPSQLTFTQTPLLNLLGFSSSTGVPWAAAGFFDLYARITTVATTGQAGSSILGRLTYAE